MNIQIIKNSKGKSRRILKNGWVLQYLNEETDLDNIKKEHLFLYNPQKNESIEIEPSIEKYDIVKISDIRNDSKYIYFTGIENIEKSTAKICIYRYDFNEKISECMYSFNDEIDKFTDYMRMRIFVVSDYYMFIQNEYLRKNISETYEGYMDFELNMYSIKEEKLFKVMDEKLNQCGIMDFIAVTTNICIIKTGYSLLTDNRYQLLERDEAVMESISFVNIGQMVSDILISHQNIVSDSIENVYYDVTIPYVKVVGRNICYSKVKLGEKLEEEIVFYNYDKKTSLMCINSKFGKEAKLATPYIISEHPYIMTFGSKATELIDIEDPEHVIKIDEDYNIKDIIDNIVIAEGQVKSLFGKEKTYTYAFNLPNMHILHREKGECDKALFMDGELNIIMK